MGQIIRTNTQLFCHLLCRQFPGDIIVDILQKLLRDIQIRRLVLFDHWNIFIHIRQQCHQKSLVLPKWPQFLMQTNICQNVQYHLSVTAEHAFLKTGRLHIIIGKFFLKFPDGIHICNDQKHSHLSHRTVGMELVRVDHQTVSCNQMIIHTSYRGIHLPFRHMDEFHMFMQMKREVRVPPDMTVIDLFPALIKRFYCVHTNPHSFHSLQTLGRRHKI